jgi:hypothetical protein
MSFVVAGQHLRRSHRAFRPISASSLQNRTKSQLSLFKPVGLLHGLLVVVQMDRRLEFYSVLERAPVTARKEWLDPTVEICMGM